MQFGRSFAGRLAPDTSAFGVFVACAHHIVYEGSSREFWTLLILEMFSACLEMGRKVTTKKESVAMLARDFDLGTVDIM